MPKRAAARPPRALTTPPKTAAETRRMMAALATQHPNADTELHFSNAYELLVATILSAQCTDERVNQVTPALFKHYPDARALARASTDELEPQIQSTGFFRAKSRSLAGMAEALVTEHGGQVPGTMEQLVSLPGVGRKTANVVLNVVFGQPTIAVDTHVHRVANRLGLAVTATPEQTEEVLLARVPKRHLQHAHHYLILHGRYTCIARRPECWRCPVARWCRYEPKTARPADTAEG